MSSDHRTGERPSFPNLERSSIRGLFFHNSCRFFGDRPTVFSVCLSFELCPTYNGSLVDSFVLHQRDTEHSSLSDFNFMSTSPAVKVQECIRSREIQGPTSDHLFYLIVSFSTTEYLLLITNVAKRPLRRISRIIVYIYFFNNYSQLKEFFFHSL